MNNSESAEVTVKVKEAQYAIGLRGERSAKLNTANIETCVAFAGINSEKGVVFLCHLNSPWCASKLLPLLIADLERLGLSLNDFNLYTSSTVSPWPLSLVASYAACAILPPALGHIGISVNGWQVFLAAFVAWTAYWHSKRIGLSVALWFAKAYKVKRRFLGYKSLAPGAIRSQVCVDANPLVALPPKVRRYCANSGDRRYAPASAPLKAKGSA
ncbi:hypothetical protein [Paraburkholderia sediminicola]|uniref:hypothetical protein n=1 Tax=Paraburkholderia sediminicola TaxID=458836 RepID=UPI0038B8F34F